MFHCMLDASRSCTTKSSRLAALLASQWRSSKVPHGIAGMFASRLCLARQVGSDGQLRAPRASSGREARFSTEQAGRGSGMAMAGCWGRRGSLIFLSPHFQKANPTWPFPNSSCSPRVSEKHPSPSAAASTISLHTQDFCLLSNANHIHNGLH